jgi:hypothetical protein
MKKCKLVKDKYNWWLIDERINIPIKNNHFIEEQIKYLSELYEKLGYEIMIDRNFGNTY